MATTYSAETAPLALTPPAKVTDVGQRGRKKHLRNTITLAAQASGDNIYLGKRPIGTRMGAIEITTSATLGSSTIAIGTIATPAKYKAAAVFTTADTPTRYALTARLADGPLTADEDLYLTIGAAALPGSGTLVVDVEYIDS